jgi:hypothetical protein
MAVQPTAFVAMNGTSSDAAWRAANNARAASPIGIRNGSCGFSAASATSAATCSGVIIPARGPPPLRIAV